MEIVLAIGFVVVISVLIWIFVQWLTSMQKTVAGSTGEVSKRLLELNRQIGEISELGRGIRSLQEFLQSPKLRGNIGEQVLKDMIGQTFPKNSFHLQYSFKSGVKVDAVLKTDAGLLCIDSKFPMENFTLMHRGETEAERHAARRDFIADVKKHITDISRKYILPEEGTMDFALMYIPSESVYYEIATIEDLMTFARRARVYPVSPNTLYAHLQVLLLSFQGKELEQKSREVFRLLRAIQKDYEKTGEQLGVLGRHIGNAYNTMSGVSGSFDVLGQKLSKTQSFTGKEEKRLEE
jgi:DNA recombination protein RmuC